MPQTQAASPGGGGAGARPSSIRTRDLCYVSSGKAGRPMSLSRCVEHARAARERGFGVLAVPDFLLREVECRSCYSKAGVPGTHTCTKWLVDWTALTSTLSGLFPLCAGKHPHCSQEEPVNLQQISWGGNLTRFLVWMSLPTLGHLPHSHLSVLWPQLRVGSMFFVKYMLKEEHLHVFHLYDIQVEKKNNFLSCPTYCANRLKAAVLLEGIMV